MGRAILASIRGILNRLRRFPFHGFSQLRVADGAAITGAPRTYFDRECEDQLPGALYPSSSWVNGVSPSQRPEDLGALTKSQYP